MARQVYGWLGDLVLGRAICVVAGSLWGAA